jgi:DnaJ-class molecular chaperone
MDELLIYGRCGRCTGTGIDDNTPAENGSSNPILCASCQGTGSVPSGKVDYTELNSDIQKIINTLKKITKKLDIKDN